MLALLDVAKRVCPKNPRTKRFPEGFGLNALSFQPVKLFPMREQLSFSILLRTPLDKTVRLAFTTRERIPRMRGAWLAESVVSPDLAGSKVTTPPD